jgi:hypothetical protein
MGLNAKQDTKPIIGPLGRLAPASRPNKTAEQGTSTKPTGMGLNAKRDTEPIIGPLGRLAPASRPNNHDSVGGRVTTESVLGPRTL